ncbi:MAG: serine hydrolase [Patescibacteria group bacterium]
MKSYSRIFFLTLIFIVSVLTVKIWGDKISSPKVSALATVKNVLEGAGGDINQESPVIDKTFVSEIASTGNFSENPTSTLKFASEGVCSEVEFSSRAILVEYLNQNISVAEINSTRRWPIASITKLITAVVAVENIDPELSITLTDKALKAEGDVGNFKSVQTFKANDLIKAMLLLSSNDAAMALSETFGSEKFLALMRGKLKEIGMEETSLYESTGLSSKNQSTPRDIAKLMRYLYNYHPEILKLTRSPRETAYEIKTKTREVFMNINKFAGQSGFIGGKTGFINDSGGNLVSLFNVRGQPVVIIVFGSNDRFKESEQILECI